MKKSTFPSSKKISVVNQIAIHVKSEIESGLYKPEDKLLSINAFSRLHQVARDSVERAYNQLKAENYITSYIGKGYFVKQKELHQLKILLLFNKLSYYKKIIYDAFTKSLGSKAIIHLAVHQYDPEILDEIITSSAGEYDYYVLMPHFFHSVTEMVYLRVIHRIPSSKLVLLDKQIAGMQALKGVFQDFKEDINNTLKGAVKLLDKYAKIVLLFPDYSDHPREIIDGVKDFCAQANKKFSCISTSETLVLERGNVYIILKESDLAQILKSVKNLRMVLGNDIGIISFNETIFKELLGITVITTDFEQMGISAASLITENRNAIIHNPFRMIVRNSL